MSVGIIGGADGPTAIFIASSFNWPLVIGTAVIIAGGIVFFIQKRKSKKLRDKG
jgi:LPXTG-motif cell wall-anchored protein